MRGDKYLIECIYGRAKAAMNAKYSIVDDGGEAEKVEYLATIAPHIHRAKFAKTLVVETVHLRYLS